jgi:hypothetical protein
MIVSNKSSLRIVKYISKTSEAGITFSILIYNEMFFHKNYSDVGV